MPELNEEQILLPAREMKHFDRYAGLSVRRDEIDSEMSELRKEMDEVFKERRKGAGVVNFLSKFATIRMVAKTNAGKNPALWEKLREIGGPSFANKLIERAPKDGFTYKRNAAELELLFRKGRDLNDEGIKAKRLLRPKLTDQVSAVEVLPAIDPSQLPEATEDARAA